MELEFIQKPYEIWIYKNELSNEYNNPINGLKYLKYFKQKKIARIGTNRFKSPIDACSPKFSMNINGKKTLTFNMYSQYLDYESGEYRANPFIGIIKNDTMISIELDGQVYDLLITKIDRNSENGLVSYTAEDAYIIELGKNGFNTELATELENNMGTIEELGAEILKNSDWRVAPTYRAGAQSPIYSDLIIQSLEDSLYEIEVSNLTSFTKLTDYLPDSYYINDVIDYSGTTITGNIYVFYNDVVENKNQVGFLYWGTGTPTLNSDGMIVNSYNYVTDRSNLNLTNKTLKIWRGRRVVKSPRTFYDNDLKKVMNVFSKPNDSTIYYGYAETDYNSPSLTENFISNPCNMTSLYDWNLINTGPREQNTTSLRIATMPHYTVAPYITCLKLKAGNTVINKGLQGHRDNIETLIEGDKYIVAFLKETSGYYDEEGNPIDIDDTSVEDFYFGVAFYKYIDDTNNFITTYADMKEEQGWAFPKIKFQEQGTFTIEETYTISEGDSQGEYRLGTRSKTYSYMELTYSGNYQQLQEDITAGLGFFLGAFISSDVDQNIYEVMFFKKKTFNGELIYPGRVPETTEELQKVYWNIYKDSNGKSELVTRIFDNSEYQMVYNEDCEKISSITGKEKNYYTLLSDLTKTFNCWMQPYIERDSNLDILYTPCYYNSLGQLIDYSITPLVATKENIGKFFSNNGIIYEVVDNKIYEWNQVVEIEDEEGNLIQPTNEYTQCYINGLPIPIKTVSYLEKFEYFINEDGSMKRNNEFNDYEVNGYFINYLYIVNFEGIDTQVGINHPKQFYYTLNIKSNYTLKECENEEISVLNKPSKWIRFCSYLNDTPNWVGFKYGINIKSIQRSEDSTNFATKVIVKNSNNEYAIKGDKLVTIARAVNNPLKDNFILDFDYYVRQGLLDRVELQEDLYGEDGYYNKIRILNEANEEIIMRHSGNSIVFDKEQAQYETYYLAYNAAQESISNYQKLVGDCGEQYEINLDNWHVGGLGEIKHGEYIDEETGKYPMNLCVFLYTENFEDMKDCYNNSIFVDITKKDLENDNGEMVWTELPVVYYYNDNLTINSKKGYYTIKDASSTPLYSGQSIGTVPYEYVYILEENQDNINKVRDLNNHHVKSHFSYKTSTLSPYNNKTDYYWNKALYDYACRIDENMIKKAIFEPFVTKARVALLDKREEMEEDIKESISLIEQKKALLRQFFSKYSDFIRESSWNSDDYIDDELYYLDARDSLHAAAFPKNSYTINVVDVSALEGMECFNLKIGDYTFIEDTEFFGWDDKGRPAKEWVVVTEASYDLEQPQNNQIKIQNYKSQIEDLFSRLSTSLQQFELNKGGYNRQIQDPILPKGIVIDDKGIYSTNFNRSLNTGWAIYSNGTYFFGNTNQV